MIDEEHCCNVKKKDPKKDVKIKIKNQEKINHKFYLGFGVEDETGCVVEVFSSQHKG